MFVSVTSVAFLSLAAGSPVETHGGHAGTVAASPDPATGVLDAVPGGGASSQLATPDTVAGATANQVLPAGSSFTCSIGSACYSTGRNNQGHRFTESGGACFGGPSTVETVINNTVGRFVYLFADRSCSGSSLGYVAPGSTQADVPSITKGHKVPHSIQIVDPAGEGSLAACHNNLCLWSQVGYAGSRGAYGATSCLLTNNADGSQQLFSVADTSSNLVGYLYSSSDCTGAPAIVAPGDAFGDLTGGPTFSSIQVVKLPGGTGTTSASASSVLVNGPGGPSLFVRYDNLAYCEKGLTIACFVFADGSVAGQIDPLDDVRSAVKNLLPAVSKQLAPITRGDCLIVPHMGASAQIVQVVNHSGLPMILGPGSCAELTRSDPGNGTVYSVAPGLTGIVGPTVAAVAYDAAARASSNVSIVSLKAPRLVGGPSAINGLGFTHLGDEPTVVSVTPDAPAEVASLLKGDQLVAINGQSLDNYPDYLDYIGRIGANTPWTLKYFEPSTGQTLTINLQPSTKPVAGGRSLSATHYATYPNIEACKALSTNTACFGLQNGQAIGLVNALEAEDHADLEHGILLDDENTLPAPEGPQNPVVEVWNNTLDHLFVGGGTSLIDDINTGKPIDEILPGADSTVTAVDASDGVQNACVSHCTNISNNNIGNNNNVGNNVGNNGSQMPNTIPASITCNRSDVAPSGQVILYENGNFTGRCKAFGTTTDLYSTNSALDFNDIASAIKVSADTSVALYVHPKFEGQCETLSGGANGMDYVLQRPFHDGVSSLKIGEC